MNLRLRKILVFSLFTAMLVLAGCQAPAQKETAPAVKVETKQQILRVLQDHCAKAVPLKANAQCMLLYYANGKPHKENFPVQLWVNFPSEIYMQGDVAFNAKGIVLGSNREEFWLALQPKEISSYWWGQWSQQSSLGAMIINPHVLLEGTGVVKVEDEQQWSFGQEDSYRVLTKEDDGKVKRIYVGMHDGRVRRIEYVGTDGEAVTVTELDKYVKASEDFWVPTYIKIIRRLTKDKHGFVNITLKVSTVKPASFTEEQRRFLFQRRPIEGLKHIYQIIDGKAIEQQ